MIKKKQSTPDLFRQPPIDGNPLDPYDMGWAKHNTSSLTTCWTGELFVVPADDCVTNNSLLCPEVGAAPDSSSQVYPSCDCLVALTRRGLAFPSLFHPNYHKGTYRHAQAAKSEPLGP